MVNYIRWQFMTGPAWLLHTMWTFEQALLQYFSVGLLLRTLVSHWHKDAVKYDRSSFTQIFISFAWNQISRGIGFIVRASVLAVWLFIQIVYLILAAAIFVLFIAWPLLVIAGFVVGVALVLV